MWADSLLPAESTEPPLFGPRQPAWWIAAAVLGLSYIIVVGRGIPLLRV